MSTRVTDVAVEHLPVPLGIGVATPRVSWRVGTQAPDWRQQAYEIQVSSANAQVWTSGRVEDRAQVLVPWPAPPLTSREQRELRVRAWSVDATEPTPWSDPLTVEAGLLSPDDWAASLVLPTPSPSADEQPVFLLRKEFPLDRPFLRARIYSTAHGIHDVEVNGQPVSQDLLSPGWTAYGSRLRYATWDVTALLAEGPNAVGIHLADGWWRGYLGFGGQRALYGDRTSALLQLEVENDDGTRTRVVTDETWRCSPGPVLSADLYNGEVHDTRREQLGWSATGFDDSAWLPVQRSDRDPAILVAPTGPPVRRTEVVPARRVLTTPSGATVVDFGINIVGRLRLRLPDLPAGTTVTVRHAEVLEHGELGTRPLRRARATDTVILDGRGAREWEPRFSVHGFRYAEVSGWPDDISLEDVRAVVLHTHLEPTGTFECSDEDLNTLHDNVVRSLRGNTVDVPTDCPQRDERLGWTGDLAVFAPAAAFLYDMSGMLTSWLRDLAAEQTHDGLVPVYVPSPDIRTPDFEFALQAEAGWGDASVVVPWTLYERGGDLGILREQWPSMTAWVGAFERRAGRGLDFPDGGFMLGDWLDANAPDDEPWKARVPWPLVAVAYLARSARLLQKAGLALGLDDEAGRYAVLADRCAARFREAYLDSDGHLTETGQTAYALAIVFDLLDTPEERTRAGDDLAARVAADGFHIGTGFLGTPYVCDALVATGHLDFAYRLLLQRECPSWLYPVTMGATTIWERWDSMLPDGTVNPGEMTSFNHYALGAIADWMHRTIAGLAPAAPGYARARVAPRPGGGLTWARAAHRTPYGWLRVEWRRDGDELVVDVEVPPNTEAVASLPGDSQAQLLGSGRHRLTSAWPESTRSVGSSV